MKLYRELKGIPEPEEKQDEQIFEEEADVVEEVETEDSSENKMDELVDDYFEED